MEFGSVNDLNAVDTGFPPDHPQTAGVLGKAAVAENFLVYIGCAKWGRKDWIGKFYPKGTKEKNFLDAYVKHFNSIELNATYHQVPPVQRIIDWANKAGDGFKFCPKFSKVITHEKRLENAGEATKYFAGAIEEFGDKLGPCFLQLPPNFSPKKAGILEKYLYLLHQEFPAEVFVEFRHPAWFIPSMETDGVFSLMEELGTGAVITDTAGRRDCLHQRLTTPSAFIRFVGNSLHPTDFIRINDWIERIDNWRKSGLQSLYFFLHNNSDETEIFTPELATFTVVEFNRQLKLNLPVPELLTGMDREDEMFKAR